MELIRNNSTYCKIYFFRYLICVSDNKKTKTFVRALEFSVPYSNTDYGLLSLRFNYYTKSSWVDGDEYLIYNYNHGQWRMFVIITYNYLSHFRFLQSVLTSSAVLPNDFSIISFKIDLLCLSKKIHSIFSL